MYETISQNQLDQWMDEGKAIMLIDLRNRSSFALCHLKGAMNVPFEEWQQQESCFLRNRCFESEKLVFYCARGGKSMRVCESLNLRGVDVWNLAGGLAAYRGKYLVRTGNLH